MKIRYLGWAGIEIEADGETAVVDAVRTFGAHTPFMGEPHAPLLAPRQGASAALLTHLHLDHADPELLSEVLAPGAPVLRPPRATGELLDVAGTLPSDEALGELGIEARETLPWESHEIGPFRFTAVPASDGFGDPQVSWVIEAGGRRVIHCGDTLFHGAFWLIRSKLGPIDAAFLPINAPVADLPHRQPASPLPVVMGPEQAAAAGALLETGVAVPIHFRELNNPPVYVRTENAAESFLEAASELSVEARVMDTGEVLSPAPRDGSAAATL